MKHPNPCLLCLIHKPKARIENWRKMGQIIVGTVYDANNHWADGEPIQTSKIVEFDPELGHVQTLNSNYLLGKPHRLNGRRQRVS